MRGYSPTGLAPDGNYQVASLALDAIGIADALAGDARRGAHRSRLGRDRVVHRGRPPARPLPQAGDARRPPHRRARRGVPLPGAAPPLLLHVRVPDAARRDGRAERRLRVHRLPLELLVARATRPTPRSCARSRTRSRRRGPPRRRSATTAPCSARHRPIRRSPSVSAAGQRPDAGSDAVPARRRTTAAWASSSPTATRSTRCFPTGSDVQIVPGTGHFLHLEQPADVNAPHPRLPRPLTAVSSPSGPHGPSVGDKHEGRRRRELVELGVGLVHRRAVDEQRVATDPAALVAHEEQRDVGDVVGLTGAAERRRRHVRVADRRHHLRERGERRVDEPRPDPAHAHAARPELHRRALREHLDAGLRAAVRAHPLGRHPRVDRRDVHDRALARRRASPAPRASPRASRR